MSHVVMRCNRCDIQSGAVRRSRRRHRACPVTFHPNLPTALHVDVDVSQIPVGAVLLWEEGKSTPRPVCCLSRQLQGAQSRYDARNVEAFATQVAFGDMEANLCGITASSLGSCPTIQVWRIFLLTRLG